MSQNTLPGNPHSTSANYADIDAEPYTQAQATLALAYEQRTASLIAWRGVLDGEDPMVEALYSQIARRLNIDAGA